jgi:hypothetical protein
MILTLSAEQRQAIVDHPDELVELIDEQSRERFVLLPLAQFERVKALLATDDFDVRESYAAQSAALAAAGWDDPELDIYNDYDANNK